MAGRRGGGREAGVRRQTTPDLDTGRRADPAETTLRQAVALHRTGQVAEALSRYREVLKSHPQHPGALGLGGTALLQLGRTEEAARLLAQSVARAAGNPETQNNLGNALRRLGRHEEALARFQAALALRPDLVEAHNNVGNCFAALGDPQKAEASYREAIRRQPRYAPAHLNLGHLLSAQRRLEEAIEAYRAAADIARDPRVLNHLGAALQDSGRRKEAERAYRAALKADPNLAVAHNNLATLLQDSGRRKEALFCYRRAVELKPDYAAARRNLGLLLQGLGDWRAAAQEFERLLAQHPEDEIAQHALAAVTGQTTERAPAGYLRAMFDTFAPSFERHLVDVLEYQAPAQLRRAVDAYRARAAPGRRFARALDLGCGTGLVARAFADIVEDIEGIDLSPAMVAAARTTGLYREVYEGEILDYFSERPEPAFDLVLAADLFIYLGELSAIFSTVAGRLTPSGAFAFSVEHAEGADYVLRPTGRYAQSEPYIARLAAAAGLRVFSRDQVVLRKEKHQPVDGRIYVLVKDG